MDTSKVVRLFIDHGALVNWQNSQGFTPLHLAARVDDVAVAETLLRAGARAEIKKKVGGLTAMQVAENFQSDNAIAILKQRHGYGDSSA
jgi:ankyrin repeat protein